MSFWSRCGQGVGCTPVTAIVHPGYPCTSSSPIALLAETPLLKPEKMPVSSLCLGRSPTDVSDTWPWWCGRLHVCRSQSHNASPSAVLPAEMCKGNKFQKCSYFKGNWLKCLLFRILRGKGKKNIGLFQSISIGIHTQNQQII